MKVAQFDVHIVIKDSEGEIKTFDYKDTPLSKVGNLTLPASWRQPIRPQPALLFPPVVFAF